MGSYLKSAVLPNFCMEMFESEPLSFVSFLGFIWHKNVDTLPIDVSFLYRELIVYVLLRCNEEIQENYHPLYTKKTVSYMFLST